MKYALGIVGALALLGSLTTCVAAKSSIHETYSAALLVAGLLGLGLGALLGELERITAKLNEINKTTGDNFMHLAGFLKERLK